MKLLTRDKSGVVHVGPARGEGSPSMEVGFCGTEVADGGLVSATLGTQVSCSRCVSRMRSMTDEEKIP